MPLPSFLNNLTKGQNNLSPNSVPASENFPTLISAILNRPGAQIQTPVTTPTTTPQVVPQTVTQTPVAPTQTAPAYVPLTNNMEAIRSGNTNNPLNQYSNEFGKYYTDANMGGYNPIAEYHKLKEEASLNAIQNKGPYQIPVGSSPDQVDAIRNSADTYYENRLGQVGTEAANTMSNIKNTITGGVLGTLPPQTAQAVKQHETDFNSLPAVKNMNVLSTTLSNAKDIYEKNLNNPGLANGTEDYRLMFLLSNAMNPSSQVSEGDYKNAQEIMGTFPAALQSKLSAYIQKDPKGNLQLSDKKLGFLTPEGRKIIYDAIQEHYNSGIGPYQFQRSIHAGQIDKDTGRPGLGNYYLPDYANPAQTQTSNTQNTQSSNTTGNGFAEQW